MKLRITIAVTEVAQASAIALALEKIGYPVAEIIDPLATRSSLYRPGPLNIVVMHSDELRVHHFSISEFIRRMDTRMLLFVALGSGGLRDLVGFRRRIDSVLNLEHRLTRAQIDLALAGYSCFPERKKVYPVRARRSRRPPRPMLSIEESKLLLMVAQGMSTGEIASALGIPAAEANSALDHLLEKLGVDKP